MHGIKNAPMHGLQSIFDIWQCPTHYDGHRILHVAAACHDVQL